MIFFSCMSWVAVGRFSEQCLGRGVSSPEQIRVVSGSLSKLC
jgi:hypothetical protein